MRKAEKRNLTKREAKEKGIYVEGHHIFPKSIFGNNKRIVHLTGREHYFAHAVLERAFIQRYGLKDQRTIKMTYAHCGMGGGKKNYLNSRLYEEARKRLILFQLKVWCNGIEIIKSVNCPGEEFSLGIPKKFLENRSWWTDGINSVRSKECPGEGWYRGHSIKIENRCTSKETKWWNNGYENSRSKECPGEGWVEGMLDKKGLVWWNNGKKNKKSLECPGEGWIRGLVKKSKEQYFFWTNGIETKRGPNCPGTGWTRGMHKRSTNKRRAG